MRLFVWFLLLAPSFVFAQSKFDYYRYTKAWVHNPGYPNRSSLTDEVYTIKGKNTFPQLKDTELSLYIPSENDLKLPNGNKYILAYLVNKSDSISLIDRADATIWPIETQIQVNGEWKNFQISMGSSCGNSYFKSKLPPTSYYTLYIERPKEGSISTNYRVKMKIGEKDIFSNTCVIQLPQSEIDKAGKPITSFSL